MAITPNSDSGSTRNPSLIVNYCCDTDYNGDGVLDQIDVNIYQSYLNTKQLVDSGLLPELTLEAVQQRYDEAVENGIYDTPTIIKHLPSFECSNFNSNVVATSVTDEVDGGLLQSDRNIYQAFVNTKQLVAIGLVPEVSIETVQQRLDAGVQNQIYDKAAKVALLPQLAPVGCETCFVTFNGQIQGGYEACATEEITCDNVDSPNFGEVYSVTVTECSPWSMEHAQEKARQEAEKVVNHIYFENCACMTNSSPIFNYTASMEVECECDCSDNVLIIVSQSAESAFSTCDARLKAINQVEIQADLAKYSECSSDSCPVYFSLAVASGSCGNTNGDSLDYIIRLGSATSCVSQADADIKAQQKAQDHLTNTFACALGLNETAVCDAMGGYIAYTHSAHLCDVGYPPVSINAKGIGVSYTSELDAEIKASMSLSNSEDNLDFICNSTCYEEATTPPFVCQLPNNTNQTLIGTGWYRVTDSCPTDVDCNVAKLSAEQHAILDLNRQVVESGCTNNFFLASSSAYVDCPCPENSGSLMYTSNTLTSKTVTAYGFAITQAEADFNAQTAADTLATQSLCCVYEETSSLSSSLSSVVGKMSYFDNSETVNIYLENKSPTHDAEVSIRVYDQDSYDLRISEDIILETTQSVDIPVPSQAGSVYEISQVSSIDTGTGVRTPISTLCKEQSVSFLVNEQYCGNNPIPSFPICNGAGKYNVVTPPTNCCDAGSSEISILPPNFQQQCGDSQFTVINTSCDSRCRTDHKDTKCSTTICPDGGKDCSC